jgi:hypothetical protein
MQSVTRTWTYGLGVRIFIGCVVAIMFAFAAFLISIPFLVPGNLTGVAWLLDVCGLAVAGFGCFMLFGLIAFSRTQISLSATGLDATVTTGHTRLLVPRFRTIVLPVAEIRSVERRDEITRMLGLSTQRESLSIVTAAGERIGLFSNTTMAVNKLPLAEIASAIAAAAEVPVTDDGTVLVRGAGLYGDASSSWTETPLDPARAAKAKNTAALTLQILVGAMLLIAVLRACTR